MNESPNVSVSGASSGESTLYETADDKEAL